MIPFSISFSKIIETRLNPNQILYLLDISENMLYKRGADRITRDDNNIYFKNRFFKFASNWNIMRNIDGGCFNISSIYGTTKIEYKITLIRTSIQLIPAILALLLVFYVPIYFLLLFILFPILGWIYIVISHSDFFDEIIKEFKFRFENDKELNELN
jgi:hypothetical protein